MIINIQRLLQKTMISLFSLGVMGCATQQSKQFIEPIQATNLDHYLQQILSSSQYRNYKGSRLAEIIVY